MLQPPMYHRDGYSGREIRRRIIANEEWKQLVPSAVVDIINDIDGVERLKQVSKTDID